MPCYKPLVAYNGPGGVVFHNNGSGNEILLPCGRCIGCKLQRANDWATRCLHEASMHKQNAFITLTYNAESMHTPSLVHRDWQLFAKRLRKALIGTRYANSIAICDSLYRTADMGLRPIPQLKTYMAGEYGEINRRPHFHACLFGIDFNDKKKYSENKYGDIIYSTKTLDEIWQHGFTTTGKITYESAAYIARYIMAKQTGELALKHYEQVNKETGEIINLTPEYNKMSLAEGIGKTWIDKYITDVYKENQTGHVITRGKKNKAPKYYDKIYKRKERKKYEQMKEMRIHEQSKQQYKGETSNERLEVKQAVKQAQLNQLKRKI